MSKEAEYRQYKVSAARSSLDTLAVSLGIAGEVHCQRSAVLYMLIVSVTAV